MDALAAAAAALGVGAAKVHLVAASPGVDAAAVAPAYGSRLSADQGQEVRVLEMGANPDRPCNLAPAAGPAPPCSLPVLPEALLSSRLPSDLEAAFIAELRRLAARIAYDLPSPEAIAAHAYKTYALVVACAAAMDGGGGEFFALGAHRVAEKARAHMHSSFALGLYDLSGWAKGT